ncbi:MAG: heme-binding protein [Burkholderiaceae bacterium]
MKQVERAASARKVETLPSRRFHRYPVLPPGVDLGPLQNLPGKWTSGETGWNMIALPFSNPAGPPFRLLLNQYKETLRFTFIDEKVANRGVTETLPHGKKDQFIVTLDYEQSIEQVAAVDEPVSGDAGVPGGAIHHEPGLFLFMTNHVENPSGQDDDAIDIGRLASIPHGNSVLALGTSKILDAPDKASLIPDISGLPTGIGPNPDINTHFWLRPYRRFSATAVGGAPFMGNITVPGFPGFDPVRPSELLKFALQGLNIKKTTVLALDTTVQSAGISNIPFIERQADAVQMASTFWIHELVEPDAEGDTQYVLQYLQDVSLDFFPRLDMPPGLIRWPHVSINTLRKQPQREWARPEPWVHKP